MLAGHFNIYIAEAEVVQHMGGGGEQDEVGVHLWNTNILYFCFKKVSLMSTNL